MNLCFLLADRIQRFRARRRAWGQNERNQDQRAYWNWQLRTSQEYFEHFFDLGERLAGSDVIDIGCGLGGRTCFLAQRSVRTIVGTDTNQQEIESAMAMARGSGDKTINDKVSFEKVSETEGTTTERKFDIALLVDSLEHVRDPRSMLNLAHSLLKPGGVCYFSTWGWYHHQASHVGSIIPIPFATLLFSDRQILDAVRRIVDQPYFQRTIWDSDPPSLRWQDCQSLHDRPGEYLNKYTIAKFRRAARDSDFSEWQLKVQGFSSSRHPVLAAFNFLTRLPLVQEVYHSALFGKLTRQADFSDSCSDLGSRPPLRIAG